MRYFTPILLLLAFITCSREIPNPTSFPNLPEMPPAPYAVTISIGDHSIRLSWQVSDTTDIAHYRIYRAESAEEVLSRFDSTEMRVYTDSNLTNGRQYFYQVSSVSGQGRESQRSRIVSAVPNLFSIVIENGAEEINTRSVQLTLVAPPTTTLMRIANDISFDGANWEPFAADKQWLLTGGAGIKRVYAFFRDSDGIMMTEPVIDSISYVIRPHDFTVLVNGGDIQTYSRSVNLQITAPQGTGFMKISTDPSFTGAVWEPLAANRDWLIGQSEAQNRDTVRFLVRFLDSAHDSIAVQAADSIIASFAEPVDLLPVYSPDDHYRAVNLQWSVSRSEDFLRYRLFRSRDTGTVDTIVAEISDINRNTFTDSLNLGALPTSTPVELFYMVRFYSEWGDSSDSDTITVSLRNTQPAAITCFVSGAAFQPDTATGWFNLTATIGWSRSDIPDFSHYVLYENTAPSSATSRPVAFVYDSGTTSFELTRNNVDSTTVFYYWMRVFDLGGQNSAYSQPDSIRYR